MKSRRMNSQRARKRVDAGERSEVTLLRNSSDCRVKDCGVINSHSATEWWEIGLGRFYGVFITPRCM